MSAPEHRQRRYWDALARTDPDAAIIDPNDRRGFKNAYLAGLRDRAFAQSLARHGVERGTLLDLGCGTASASHPLLRAGHRVLGLDISLQLLRHAQKRCDNLDCLFVAVDGRRLPVAASVMDAAVVYVVLSYVTDDAAALALLEEVRATLKPGAPLIMIEQARTRRALCEDGLKVHRSIREWTRLLRQAGFRLDDTAILRHGRFPTTPLVAAGAIPRAAWPWLARFEAGVARVTGVFGWDYAEVRFEAKA